MREYWLATHFFHPRKDMIACYTVMCVELCPKAVLVLEIRQG